VTLASVDPAALRQLLSEVRAGAFDWSLPSLELLLRRLGWTVTQERAGAGMLIDTGWGFEKAVVLLEYRDDLVNSITALLTESVFDRTAEKQDAFVDLVAQTREVLGPPTSIEPGDEPQVEWRDPATTFIVQRTLSNVIGTWARTAYHLQMLAEIKMQLAEAGEEG
jgi:hypothetical protein